MHLGVTFSIFQAVFAVNVLVWYTLCALLYFQGLVWRWLTATTSTASWSICSPSTSGLGTPTPPSGNGWSISTGTPTAPTWVTSTCWPTFPSPRTKARRGCVSTSWRRCYNRAARRPTSPTTRSRTGDLSRGRMLVERRKCVYLLLDSVSFFFTLIIQLSGWLLQ